MTVIARICPYKIYLKDTAGENVVHCEQVLRSLPGKRLVYKGTWLQRSVIVKLFLDPRSALRHRDREKAGVDALKNAHVSTPELLFSGQLEDGTPVLVFDFLPEAETALEVWSSLKSAESKSGFLRQLVELVGTLHDAGLVQEDLHLENFLVTDQQLYAIDGDAVSVRASGEGLDLKTSSKNLALLFAQLSPEDDVLIESAGQHYLSCRKMSETQLLARLKTDLPDVRRKRRLKYVNKCYRSCREFVRIKRANKVAISRRDVQGDALNCLLDDPDALISKGEKLKDGKTSTVVRVQIGEYDWVIKRYNIKSFWHVMSRCFRPTRAWISWGNAHRLKISGIPTPKAVAMIEKRFGPLRSTGYYVCDFVEGPRAEVFFQDDTLEASFKERAARGFVHLFELLYKLGIHHGDCKAANFLPGENTPWVLDLDAMHECLSPGRFKKLYQEDRQRFLHNWRSQPELLRWFDEHLPR